MVAEALAIDTPRRLSRLVWHGHPILSVYLDLDPTRFPPQLRATRSSAHSAASSLATPTACSLSDEPL
jgi:hypothetical protein